MPYAGCNLPEVLAHTGLRPGTPPSLRPAGDVPQSRKPPQSPHALEQGQQHTHTHRNTNTSRKEDYVYFENSSSNPLLIRRIEELNKTANGNVEAKVVCFYRRRDISTTLITLADKHARE
ncbi:unnamed protein product [Leuciscus chuanchicus]